MLNLVVVAIVLVAAGQTARAYHRVTGSPTSSQLGALSSMSLIGAAAAVVSVGAVVTAAIRVSMLAFVLPLIAAALLVGVVWRNRRRQPLAAASQAVLRLPRAVRLLPLAWLAMIFVFVQKFSHQALSGESVSRGSAPSVENFLQIGLHLLVVGLVIFGWRAQPPAGRDWWYLPLLAWPAWSVLSTLWSPTPAYTLVRSSMLFVPILLAVHSARLLDSLHDDGTALATPFLRLYASLSSLLVLISFVFPYTPQQPSRLSTSAFALSTSDTLATAPSGRLSWYGVHPLVAAEVFGVAALIVAVAGPHLLRLSFAGWTARLTVLVVGTVRAEGRSVYVGLLIALLVAIWVRLRGRHVPRALAVSSYLAVCIAAVVLLHAQLLHAAERGGDTSGLLTLNGRIPLWRLAIAQLQTVKEVFLGFGFGTSGELLSQRVAFAGHAHNSVVEALVGTGLIGVLLLGVWLARLGWRLRASAMRPVRPRRLQAVLASVFAVLLILSIGSPELATPGFSYSMICFVAVFTLRGSTAPPPGGAGGGRRVSEVPATPAAPLAHSRRP